MISRFGEVENRPKCQIGSNKLVEWAIQRVIENHLSADFDNWSKNGSKFQGISDSLSYVIKIKWVNYNEVKKKNYFCWISFTSTFYYSMIIFLITFIYNTCFTNTIHIVQKYFSNFFVNVNLKNTELLTKNMFNNDK